MYNNQIKILTKKELDIQLQRNIENADKNFPTKTEVRVNYLGQLIKRTKKHY